MIQKTFSFRKFGFSSQVIRDLVDNNDKTADLVANWFSEDELIKQIDQKVFTAEQRRVLVSQLKSQNAKLNLSDATVKNIESLQNSNAWTITTGHQLNLLTGPLYSLYKIAQVITISEALKKRQPENYFVPVFWMATEDHDFDEINHINLFGNKIAWEKQDQENYIVGEVQPNSIDSFLAEIEEKFRDEEQLKIVKEFTDCYRNAENLAEASRMLVNKLFGDYGVVVLDGNDAELKKAFAPVAVKEIQEAFVYDEVSKANKALEEKGYHSQVFVRECNLFFIHESGKRERIARDGDVFEIGDKKYPATELVEMIESNPKQFSPNALLRPVYQETIMPNLTYVGGGGEIAYWLQLKGVFNRLNLTFPLLRVRDSILLMRGKELNDLEELGFEIPDLKQNVHDLVKKLALNDVEVEIQLDQELSDLDSIKQELLQKAETINKGLQGMIEAEFSKMQKSVKRIEAGLIKAEKGKHDQKAKKLTRLQQKIYPSGGFQERYENFISYFVSDSEFVNRIVTELEMNDQPAIRVVEI